MKNNCSIILLNALPDKKIKSLGNKYLIKINKTQYLIDYQIKFLKSIFYNPEIVIVGGFDSKRLKKYISNHFQNTKIKYIEHDIDDMTNIGTSIKFALNYISHQNLWIINSTVMLHNKVLDSIRSNTNESFVLTHKSKNNIGYIDNNKKLVNCYYDLPNTILDTIYINKKDIVKFTDLCNSDIEKLYFFEILNLCVESNISLSTVDIPSKYVYLIDSILNIEKIKKKLCIS